MKTGIFTNLTLVIVLAGLVSACSNAPKDKQTQLVELKAEQAKIAKQIAVLEEEVQKIRTENQSLARNVSERDSLINVNNETIKVKEENLAALEARVQEMVGEQCDRLAPEPKAA